ncbi:MAG: SHOCT domain-containing protein [Anaerolineales bacterium]
MKKFLVSAVIILGISLFCGIVIISIGFGSVITQLNQVAGPVVCGQQQLAVVQHTSSYEPGEESWSMTAYCIDPQTGDKQDVTTAVQLVAGTIYGLILFAIIIIAVVWLPILGRGRSAPKAGAAVSVSPAYQAAVTIRNSSEDVDEKLKKLKQLHDQALITDQEYEQKKAEILENI